MLFHRSIVVGQVMTNCYIVADRNTGDAVVIDPGDNAPAILEIIKSNNLSLRYIFLTHGHFDHVLAVDELRAATGAPCAIHENDAELMTKPPFTLAAGKAPSPADTLVKGGEVFEVGGLRFSWMHTPGHTEGSCCIICGEHIYSGDTLFENDHGRCDLPGGSYPKILNSLKALSELEGDYKVYPGHDISTTLENERAFIAGLLSAAEKNA